MTEFCYLFSDQQPPNNSLLECDETSLSLLQTGQDGCAALVIYLSLNPDLSPCPSH